MGKLGALHGEGLEIHANQTAHGNELPATTNNSAASNLDPAAGIPR